MDNDRVALLEALLDACDLDVVRSRPGLDVILARLLIIRDGGEMDVSRATDETLAYVEQWRR